MIIGTFRNRTLEHVPIGTFVKDLERAYVNSGRVRLVASRDERAEVRDERDDQQTNASSESRARIGKENGANYMLQQRLSREGLQHLRQVGFHPLALTRGEYDDGKLHDQFRL